MPSVVMLTLLWNVLRLALLADTQLGWKGLPGANTLSLFRLFVSDEEKRCIGLTPGWRSRSCCGWNRWFLWRWASRSVRFPTTTRRSGRWPSPPRCWSPSRRRNPRPRRSTWRPEVTGIKLFNSALMKEPNKLERLSLAKFLNPCTFKFFKCINVRNKLECLYLASLSRPF